MPDPRVIHVLVATASRHGATAEIGEALAAGLRARELAARARPIEEVKDLDGCDAIVLGSAVYMGRWLKPARRFVRARADELAARPVWLFSSGPLGPAGRRVPESEPTDVPTLLAITGARSHTILPGRLELACLSPLERAAVRAVHAEEQDSRDWGAVDALAGRIAADLRRPDSGPTGPSDPSVRGVHTAAR